MKKYLALLLCAALLTSALPMAALGAEGVSQVSGLEHIRRGYEDLEGQLTALGAQVRLIH